MSEIQYTTGVFHTYRATENINIGVIDTKTNGGYTVVKDEMFRYDGATIILNDGREFGGIPQIRGAIKAGWFVPEKDSKAVFRSKSAGIEVRPTEQRGWENAKHRIQTEDHEEAVVGSIAARKEDRDTKFAAGSRQPKAPVQAPLVPDYDEVEVYQDAPSLLRGMLDFNEQIRFDSGDSELNEICAKISDFGKVWLLEQLKSHDSQSMPTAKKAGTSFGLLDLFESLDEMDEPEFAPRRARTIRAGAPEQPSGRMVMPVSQGDDSESEGVPVGRVAARATVSQEASIDMKVGRATPSAPETAPRSRFGAAGVVVVDDQRDLGQIGLSHEANHTDMDSSAKVQPNHTESVRMSKEAQVGGKKAPSRRTISSSGDQEGVPVGRILSPTHTEFTATDSNTNTAAVERAQSGKALKVVKVASGDVEETQVGDDLEDILPDAARPPKTKTYLRPEEDPAYQEVLATIPNFKWDKDRRWQVRVEDAMKYIKKPAYLRAILKVETEIVQEAIKKRLAEELLSRK